MPLRPGGPGTGAHLLGRPDLIAAKVWIYIDPDDPDWGQEFYPTIVHEFGHAIGVNHNSNPNSVMRGTAAFEPYYITAHDCDALAHQGYRPGDAGCGGMASEPILWP
jgi:hypothetical protein